MQVAFNKGAYFMVCKKFNEGNLQSVNFTQD